MVALGVLACGLPSWAQDKAQASPSLGDSYSEYLKELSSGQNASKPASKAKSPESSKDELRPGESYSEHLEGLSGGENVSKPHSDIKSSQAYRDHLRDLAQGDNSGIAETNAKSESSREDSGAADGERDRESRAKHVTVSDGASSSPTPAKTVTNSDKMERVSVTRTEKNEGVQPAGITPQTIPVRDCGDAYCEQLRRVAEGHTPEPYVSRTDDGRTLTTERNFVKNLAFDQIHIWESPFKMRDSDATWAVPFGIVTGSLVATDRDVSKQLAKPSRVDTSKQISSLGLYSFIGAGAGFYGWGLISHDDHKRETGLLSGEAFINATLVAQALKYAFGRQRPFEGDHFGHIGRGGSSFPSEHAIGSWAVATVFAHEYPNPFMQIAAYGLASAVSVSRITAGQHFPSDVFVGSTFGYLIGRKIYKDHHNSELGGLDYGTFVGERNRDGEHSGSAYVPLESWVYPVIDRLAALGYVHSNFDSERPFTRLECARLAAEAADKVGSDEVPSDVRSMIDSLQREFNRESDVWAGDSNNRSAELESIYTREMEISGPPLRDGYHFGQTLYNDYGRPYGRGFNSETGFAMRATSGPLVFYFRGEYQHAPGNPNFIASTKSLLSAADDFTPQLDNQFPSADHFQVLDAYLGINFAGNQLTLGQQSLWWGPGTGGPFMLTNNAEPLNMMRLATTNPIELPGFFRYLGPLRYDVFFGQTDGQHYDLAQPRNGQSFVLYGPHLGTQPFVQGQRFSFKPTKNFEFGFSRTGVLGGTGFPLTFHRFIASTFSTGNAFVPGAASDPGDRRSGVDITYKVPWIRDWLTFYLDEFSDDEISPLFVPRRSAMHPGIYVSKMPKFHRLDLRVEGIYTDPPSFGNRGFFYSNDAYPGGYTKNGDLLGSWIGREGRGVVASSTLWLAARNTLRLGYREATVDREFLEGGRYQDFDVKANFQVRPAIELSVLMQREHWRFPALAAGPQTNFTSSVQITYSPSWHRGILKAN
jgi:hypothetical protein